MGQTEPNWFNVHEITYHIHKKVGSPDSFMVAYHCDKESIREWVCANHGGFARQKAVDWVMMRTEVRNTEGITVENLIKFSDKLRKPSRIKVTKSGKYWEIKDYEFRKDAPSGEAPNAAIHANSAQTLRITSNANAV